MKPWKEHLKQLVDVPLTDFELRVLRTALHYYEAEVMDPKNDMRYMDDPGATELEVEALTERINYAIKKHAYQRREKKGVA
tara:strand:- start:414 stop:656 length:243 start_codon:yes stop_codon:yes gene_type:complete